VMAFSRKPMSCLCISSVQGLFEGSLTLAFPVSALRSLVE